MPAQTKCCATSRWRWSSLSRSVPEDVNYGRLARGVVERVARLLSAPVALVDDANVVVAASEGEAVGRPVGEADGGLAASAVRLPVRLDGHQLHLVVGEPAGAEGERVPRRLAEAVAELIVSQVSVISRLRSQYELTSTFIHDLLFGQIRDEADALREAQILGMDLARPRAVVLIDAADYVLGADRAAGRRATEARARRRAEIVISSVVGFFNLPDDTICGYVGNGEVAVLKASRSRDLLPWSADLPDQEDGSWANLAALKRAAGQLLRRLRHDTKCDASIGVGRHHPGVRGLARSYQDARSALTLGRIVHGPNRVYSLDEVGIASFVAVSDAGTKAELAEHLLAPLDPYAELVETLTVYFDESCSPSATAARLCIHRNTLAYRLDRVVQLVGLDPRRFDDAVQLRIALLLRSLGPGGHALGNGTNTRVARESSLGQMPYAAWSGICAPEVAQHAILG
jgi:carbohydrate diacid regulator